MQRNKSKQRGNPSYSQCSRKVAFADRKSAGVARRELEARGSKGLRVYKCPFCKQYHVGHKDKKDKKKG